MTNRQAEGHAVIRLELPWPPSVNHYWRFGRGHFHISSEGRAYKLMVAGIIATAGIRPFSGNVRVTLDAHPPDRRRRDLDNLEKAVFDACAVRRGFATGLYFDDVQVKRKESTMWEYDPERAGRVLLAIEPWHSPNAARVPLEPHPPADLAAACRRQPAGESSWPQTAPALSWLSATVTSLTKAIPRWRQSAAWPNT